MPSVSHQNDVSHVLQTGALVLRLSHSSDKRISLALKQSRAQLRPYGGVTHLQCLQTHPDPPAPAFARGTSSSSSGEDSLCAFVSACSGGFVKVWRLGSSSANGQSLGGGRWSGRRKGPQEEEPSVEDDLVLSDQATLEVSAFEQLPTL